MSAATLTYEFEELPLLRETRRFSRRVHGMLVNGQAEISVEDDGSWSIDRIWMEAFTGNSFLNVVADGIEIPRQECSGVPNPLWTLAYDALMQDAWKDRLQDLVDRSLAEQREGEGAYHAEIARDTALDLDAMEAA